MPCFSLYSDQLQYGKEKCNAARMAHPPFPSCMRSLERETTTQQGQQSAHSAPARPLCACAASPSPHLAPPAPAPWRACGPPPHPAPSAAQPPAPRRLPPPLARPLAPPRAARSPRACSARRWRSAAESGLWGQQGRGCAVWLKESEVAGEGRWVVLTGLACQSWQGHPRT